jgi:hypothetical protein
MPSEMKRFAELAERRLLETAMPQISILRRLGEKMRTFFTGRRERPIMRKAGSIGLLTLAVSLFTAGCSVFGGKAADEPAYRVVQQDGKIEVREYDGFAVAETTVVAPFDEATGTGFRRLFDYISGANQSATKIEMTAPVLSEPEGEKITMTAPVLAQPRNEMRAVTDSSLTPEVDESWTIAFVLPESLAAASAPQPTDSRVTLRDLPSRRVASITFSGRFRNSTAEAKRQTLADWLESRGLSHQGDWQFAGYNPPWTIPVLRRNEVLVTLR